MHTRLLPFIQKDKLEVENYDKKEDEEDETQMSLIKMEDGRWGGERGEWIGALGGGWWEKRKIRET